MVSAIHTVHDAFCAKRFVSPLVEALRNSGHDITIYTEPTLRWTRSEEASANFFSSLMVGLTPNPFAFVSRLVKMIFVIRGRKPQLLHAHMTKGSLIPLLAAWICRVRIRIYHNHGLPYLGYKGPTKWALQALETLHAVFATHVVFVSKSNLLAAQSLPWLNKNTACVVGSGTAAGIDNKAYGQSKGMQGLQLSRNAVVFGYVGRPVARKGFHDMVAAWTKSGLGQLGGVLIMAGCSREDCETAGGSKNCPKGIVPLGFVENMPDFYASCDVVVLPSYHEGFPYTLLEGAAAGCALVGSNVPGIHDAILEGETGLLHPPGDLEAIAKTLVRLFHDKDLRQRLGRAAQLRAIAEFDAAKILEAWSAYYSRLINHCSEEAREGTLP